MIKYSNVLVTRVSDIITLNDMSKGITKNFEFDSEHDCDVAYQSIADFVAFMIARLRSSDV